MQQRVLYLFIGFVSAAILLGAPVTAMAEGAVEAVPPAPIIITEVQTGAATASDEFIELYNQSAEPIDITGWHIRYLNSTSAGDDTTLLATIQTSDSTRIVLASGEYYVLRTQTISIPDGIKNQTFTASLSKTDKTIALFARDETTCEMVVQDAVAWESTVGTTNGEGTGVLVSGAAINKDKLLQRYRNDIGEYIDTNNNAVDFALNTVFTGATPGAINMPYIGAPPVGIGSSSSLPPVTIPACTIPEQPIDPPDGESPPSTQPEEDDNDGLPIIPPGNMGLKNPQLSELLPNPASPRTDARDEFIELYNPNDSPFELSGYVLEVGTTTKRRYTFPAGTMLQPKAFMAFFSSETGLALSNAGGQVRLLNPHGLVLGESDAYTSAKDDHVWQWANGVWQWSVTPTPNALNIVNLPEAKQASKKKSTSKSASAAKGKPASEKNESDTAGAAVAAMHTPSTPLHPGVLAIVGGFAVLYGAYEYRQDVANKIRQLRTNRATRRSSGGKA